MHNSISPQKPRPASLALSFMGVGLVAFVVVLVALWVQPDLLLGDPYRREALLLAHAVALGFVASILFGASYLILPVMTGASVWSVKLGWMHWLFHLLAVLLIGVSLAFPGSLHPMYGLGVLSLGIILCCANLMMTASSLNRWDPALLTIFSAFCWLALIAGLSLWLFLDLAFLDQRWYSASLLEAQAIVALVGFFWLFILGAALKILSMFLASRNRPGLASWLGLVILNIALFMMPIGIMAGIDLELVVILLVLTGTLGYCLDFLRISVASKHICDGDILTAFFALLLVLPVIVWVVFGKPLVVESVELAWQEQARAYFVMTLLGSFALVVFGLGQRIVPFMAWQLKYLPKVGIESVPGVETLSRPAARGAVMVSLILAWVYLAAGQLWQSPVGVQFAVVCFGAAVLWTLYAVSPAFVRMLQKRKET